MNDAAINGRWLVTNVMGKTTNTPASFDLVNLDGTPSNGDGTTIPPNTGTWTWNAAFVTFKASSVGTWTPPKDNALHAFTFSITSGTVVPTGITGPTGALPGAVVTISGKGLTGVFGVSFNGYPGTIVGGSISSITNTTAARSLSLSLLERLPTGSSPGTP